MIEGARRMAGDVELPGELDALRNLLLKGMIKDETGQVVISPRGEVEIQPANSPFMIRGSAGMDPSIYVGYQSRKPMIESTPAEFALDEALRRFDEAQRY